MAPSVAPQQVWITWEKVTDMLQIPGVDVRWLINTSQLSPRVFRNEMMFNSLDVWRLIQAYSDVAQRRTK